MSAPGVDRGTFPSRKATRSLWFQRVAPFRPVMTILRARARSILGLTAATGAAVLMACSGSNGGATNGGTPNGGDGTSAGDAGSPSNGMSDSGSRGGEGGGSIAAASLRTNVAIASVPRAGAPGLSPMLTGSASASGLASLKYHFGSIMICEDLDVQGSGFGNSRNCLSVYDGGQTTFTYDPSGDLSPLADQARHTTSGFVDLMNATSRATLGGTTVLGSSDVHAYNYGIITWAPPLKVTATLRMSDGSLLYSHDGPTSFHTIGADAWHDYFTAPATSLGTAPAEEAVVLLPNGGNWFKFQAPLTITAADISERKSWVLDLVFDPEGIVHAFSGGPSGAQIREEDAHGQELRGITVPMIDLAPIPHRESEQVVRESYIGHMIGDGNPFDVRIELYSVDGDPTRTVYGVDAKTLVASTTTARIPDLSKISFVDADPSGKLTLSSWSHAPVIKGFARSVAEGDTTTASVVCATHADSAASEGGSAIVMDTCPGHEIPVTFTLTSRTTLGGSIAITSDAGAPDAAVDAAGVVDMDGAVDGGAPLDGAAASDSASDGG